MTTRIAGHTTKLTVGDALSRFRNILKNNTRVLEIISQMEQALGGDFVFDHTFLNSSLDKLAELVRQVIGDLNVLSGRKYVLLYDRFTEITDHLADLVSGGPGPLDNYLVLSYHLLHRDLDYLTGAKNAILGEIRNQLKLPTPDGFAVTTTAYFQFLEHNGLIGKINEILFGGENNIAKADAIKTMLEKAEFPPRLVDEFRKALQELNKKYPHLSYLAVRSSAIGEDGARSFAGQYLTLLQVNPDPKSALEAYREIVISRFSASVLDYLSAPTPCNDYPMAVGVQVMVMPRAAGVLYSKDPAAPGADRMLVYAVPGTGDKLVDGTMTAERYSLDANHPFALRTSDIVARPNNLPLADGLAPLDFTDSGVRRGTALLNSSQLRGLAETAAILKKSFDGPLDIEWAISDEGLVVLQCRSLDLPVTPPPLPSEIAAALEKADILMSDRGQIAQLGSAAGRIYHVTPDTDPDNFPVGGIAVAHRASPRLSPIVRKAAAVITDIGGPAGHLATIAREYSTPALFGAGIAVKTLEEGMEVTVDVETRRVYAGRVDALIRSDVSRDDSYLRDPEVRTLRRLLRWIAPLNLVNPASPDFAPKNCRTLHDLIRFCHEKAVETLINLHGKSTASTEAPNRPLAASLPISIKIIDLDAALEGRPGDKESISPEQITSRPFRDLLSGLLLEDGWSREPAPFGIKDLMSSLGRPLSQMINPPAFSGDNLAIIAADYCNLSLRLGYHFNVIDTFFSDFPEENYIYFRFVGGFAERRKRERRAELMAMILESLSFKTDRQGDLLVGKAKMLEAGEMSAALKALGELIAFTRQLDVQMRDEATIDHFFHEFIKRFQSGQDIDGQE